MYKSEDKQLELFVTYLKNSELDDELRLKDWRLFAAGYNGRYYWKNDYHNKLEKAYKSYL
jgi:hypothetical protein